MVAVARSGLTSPSGWPAARRNVVVTRAATGTRERWAASAVVAGSPTDAVGCDEVKGRAEELEVCKGEKRKRTKGGAPCMTNHDHWNMGLPQWAGRWRPHLYSDKFLSWLPSQASFPSFHPLQTWMATRPEFRLDSPGMNEPVQYR
jgi:hypothetical protein